MKVVPVASHCDRLVLPTPFPAGPVQAYLLGQRDCTLIDTGPYLSEAVVGLHKLLTYLEREGRRLVRILLTHGHLDHSGNAAWLQAETGAEVWCPPGEIPELRGVAFWEEIRPAFRELLLREGFPLEEADSLVAEFVSGAQFGAPGARANPLSQETVFAAPPFHLTAISTPGHSPDHYCFWEPEQRWLFSGDHLLPKIAPEPILSFTTPDPDGWYRGFPAYEDSILRCKGLDAAWLLPGHGEPVETVAAVCERAIRHFRLRRAKAQRLIQEGVVSGYGGASKMLTIKSPFDVFLGISEFLAHREVLKSQG